MKVKALNPQILLEFLCYFIFGGLMLYLVASGKYLSYVTPRMEPYLYFTAIVMEIWAFAGLRRLFRPQYKIRSAHCFVLVIPILLLLLPHSALSTTSSLSLNYIGGDAFSNRSGKSSFDTSSNSSGSAQSSFDTSQNQIPSASDDPLDYSADSMAEGGIIPTEDFFNTMSSENLPGLDTANRRITVSDDDFGTWISEIYTNMQKYEGYTVVMTGFVFKDNQTFQKDEFVPARLMMTCCVADLVPTGLLCKYDKASELKAESWITVEGTLFIGQTEYEGVKYDEPQITAIKITPAEAVSGYIYPY